MRIKMQTVTPELATMWLEFANTHNRPIFRDHVRRISAELEAGTFRETHQGIAFAEDGTLLDGQHRLMAIAETGIPHTMPVAFGLAPEAQEGIDQGYKRTLGHTLAAEGVPCGKRVGAIARTILTLAEGKRNPSNVEGAAYTHQHLETFARYTALADRYTAAVAAAFAYADTRGMKGVHDASRRLFDLQFLPGEGDPMRALKLALDGMRGTSGAKSMATRFWTTYNVLRSVDAGRPLHRAKHLDHAPGN